MKIATQRCAESEMLLLSYTVEIGKLHWPVSTFSAQGSVRVRESIGHYGPAICETKVRSAPVKSSGDDAEALHQLKLLRFRIFWLIHANANAPNAETQN